VHRRGFLRTLSATGIAVVGGCVGPLGGRPRYLESVRVRNDDDVDHEFGLTIERGEEVVQETTVELDRSAGPTRVDCEWSGRGPFVVTCTLGGDETETVRVSEIEEGAGEYASVTFLATVLGNLGWSAVLDDGGVRRCSGSSSG
jgi:hypothetical protein